MAIRLDATGGPNLNSDLSGPRRGIRAVSELIESRGLVGNRIDLRVFSGQ